MAKFNRFDVDPQAPYVGQSSKAVGPSAVEVSSPNDDVKTRVDRLAHDLSQISASLSDVRREIYPQQDNSTRDLTHALAEAAVVRKMIAERRRRSRFFPADIFADPGWDILLDLYLAEIEQRRIMVSSLCVAADVPPTTALRWITALLGRGMLFRKPDKLDRRRVYVELAPTTSDGMRSYFHGDEIKHSTMG